MRLANAMLVAVAAVEQRTLEFSVDIGAAELSQLLQFVLCHIYAMAYLAAQYCCELLLSI